MTKLTTKEAKSLGPAEEFRVEREGELDLEFDGWRLGRYEHAINDRHTAVAVYLTKGGKLVTAVEQWRAGSGPASARAAVNASPAAALEWLRDDAGGTLGRASKEAWAEACENCDALHGLDVERVG